MDGPMRCFVCGANLEEGVDCAECGTAAVLQERLLSQTARSRFLFGRIRPDEVDLSRPSPPVPRRETRTRKPARPKPTPPQVNARDFSLPLAPDPDVIRARDSEPAEFELPQDDVPRNLTHRVVPYSINVISCTLLNLLVMQLVLVFSGRDLQPLVVFSLVPLFFVLICFTALYFGLFAMVFGKSLGWLLFERWRHQD